jgi:DnaJ-class molecular chaperone
MATRYHPDNPDTGDATMFQRVAEANSVLSDPVKRAAYDAQQRVAAQAQAGAPAPNSAPAAKLSITPASKRRPQYVVASRSTV